MQQQAQAPWHALSGQVCMQWATVVVIEQMQRWRCPTYTPRTTIIAPYSSTEVVHALPEAEKHTLLFFRCGPHPAPSACLCGFHSARARMPAPRFAWRAKSGSHMQLWTLLTPDKLREKKIQAATAQYTASRNHA